MIHWAMNSTALNFEGDCEWEVEWKISKYGSKYPWIKCSSHPNGGGDYRDFEKDGMSLSVEELKKKWDIVDIQALNKYHCRAGYTDRLHPEKSWMGHNPETLEKLKRYMEQLDKEETDDGP